MFFCPICGRQLQRYITFCPYCGSSLEKYKDLLTEEAEENPDPKDHAVNQEEIEYYRFMFEDCSEEELQKIVKNEEGYSEAAVGVAEQLLTKCREQRIKEEKIREEKIKEEKRREETEFFEQKFKAYSDDELLIVFKNIDEYSETARNVANSILEKRKQERLITKEQEDRSDDPPAKNPVAKDPVAKDKRYYDTVSVKKLWSWLKQSSNKQILYSEDIKVNADDYAEKLRIKLDENRVPAEIKNVKVAWDESGVSDVRYYSVKPITNAENPFTYLLLFNTVGKYSFVEEKSFITPPDLPPKPEKPVPVPEGGSALFFILGCVMTLYALKESTSRYDGGSFFDAVLLFAGLGLLLYSVMKYSARENSIAHNKKCLEMEKAWNGSWEKWEKGIFNHAFQEDINGELSRIFDAVFECIKQVNQEVFPNVTVKEDNEAATRNEIEQAIARRKEEYR